MDRACCAACFSFVALRLLAIRHSQSLQLGATRSQHRRLNLCMLRLGLDPKPVRSSSGEAIGLWLAHLIGKFETAQASVGWLAGWPLFHQLGSSTARSDGLPSFTSATRRIEDSARDHEPRDSLMCGPRSPGDEDAALPDPGPAHNTSPISAPRHEELTSRAAVPPLSKSLRRLFPYPLDSDELHPAG